jgi:DNA-binding SARP family transcriptional activator
MPLRAYARPLPKRRGIYIIFPCRNLTKFCTDGIIHPMLQIALLGGLTLAWDDQPLPTITSTRARALFAYLVLNRHQSHSRTALTSLFWPDHPEPQARRRLRQALWHITRRVDDLPPGPYLLRESDQIGFDTSLPHQVDVDVFDRLSQGCTEEMAQAAHIYRGHLLPDIYEDWALLEQERLRERWLTLLDQLARAYHKEGQLDAATEAARMLLQADPWHESAARLLMELLADQGRTGEALQVYHALRANLQTDLNILPAIETTELYGDLRARHPQTPIPDSPSLPVTAPIIRKKESALLEDALRSARQGQGRLILLTGPAGIGKTTLAQQTAERARQMGFLALYTHAVEPFGPPAPYSPLDDALRAGLTALGNPTFTRESPLTQTALAALLPDLASSSSNIDTTALAPDHFHAALAGALTEMTQNGPLLLILDDLHWADPATWAVLRALLSRLAGCPLAVIAAFRAADLPATLAPLPDRLAVHPAAHSLALSQLSSQEIGQLAAQLLGTDLPVDFVTRLHRETGGNPLFTAEIVRGLIEGDGQLAISFDRALPLPPTLSQALAARLSHLTPQALGLLHHAAVLGDDFAFELLWALSGEEDEERLLEQLEELLDRNLLVEADDTYHFAHNLVRRVLYDEIHPRRRRIWHRRAAEALAQLAPQRIAARARHAHAAQTWEEALELNLTAAEQALALFAVEEAGAFFHLAKEAEDHLENTPPATRLRRLHGLARVYQIHSDEESEAQALEDWRSLAHSMDAPVEEALALATLANNLCRRGRSTDALPLAQEAVRLAGDNHQILSTALHNLGSCHEAQGDQTAALVFYNQAVDAARMVGATQQEAECLNSLGLTLNNCGEVEQSAKTYQRSATLAAACGDRLAESRALNNLGTLHVLRGEYGPARRVYEDVLAAVKSLDIRRGICIVEDNLTEVWLLMGYLKKAYAYAESSLRLVIQLDWPAIHAKCLMDLANVNIAAGELQRATDLLQEARQILPKQELLEQHLYYLYLSTKVSLAMGDIAAATEQADRLNRQARQIGMDWISGQIATLEGKIKAAQGDLRAAEKALRQAVEVCETQGLNTDAANARAELGLVLKSAGQDVEAAQFTACAWEEMARRMMRLDLACLLERLDRPPALPGQQTVTLPKHDAPLRRHLTPEECTAVLWTPDAGSLEPSLRRVPLRRARLRRLLTEAAVQGAAPTIKHLAQALNVSPATLKTDLAALREEGWPVHTRGKKPSP